MVLLVLLLPNCIPYLKPPEKLLLVNVELLIPDTYKAVLFVLSAYKVEKSQLSITIFLEL